MAQETSTTIITSVFGSRLILERGFFLPRFLGTNHYHHKLFWLTTDTGEKFSAQIFGHILRKSSTVARLYNIALSKPGLWSCAIKFVPRATTYCRQNFHRQSYRQSIRPGNPDSAVATSAAVATLCPEKSGFIFFLLLNYIFRHSSALTSSFGLTVVSETTNVSRREIYWNFSLRVLLQETCCEDVRKEPPGIAPMDEISTHHI